jgi:hypothetical protein
MFRRTGVPLRSLTSAAACSLLALCCASCGAGPRKPVNAVRGQVLYAGKPVPGALVVFHPLAAEGEDSVRPSGQTDRQGYFRLTSYAPQDGAPAGDYGVTVELWQARVPRNAREGDSLPPTNRLPVRYSTAQGSGLRASVAPGDNELTAFQLKR